MIARPPWASRYTIGINMFVLVMMGGFWIGEFGGPYAMYECLDYTQAYDIEMICVTLVNG